MEVGDSGRVGTTLAAPPGRRVAQNDRVWGVAAAYSLYELIAVALARRLAATTLNRVVGATYVAAATGLAVLAAA